MTYKKVLDVQDDSSSGIQGVHILDEMNDMKQAFTLSALTNDETEVSVCSFFDPKGPGREIWTPLSKLGYFENGGVESKVMESQVTQPGQGIGVGLSVRKYIAAGSGTGDSGTGDLNRNEETIEMSLVWTMGVVQFRNRNQTHRRYYSKWFPGENVFSAELMSEYALTHYKEWNQAIDSWQKPTLEDEHLPSWYKSCIFNELYYISDGGTVWFRDEDETALDPEDPRLVINTQRFGLEMKTNQRWTLRIRGSSLAGSRISKVTSTGCTTRSTFTSTRRSLWAPCGRDWNNA
uniref:Non-lysosomal glucosylceramidase n=1 Tax=Cacopsylla melanoneura TaxID=428564 RepID=A0A8D8W7E3_9HEMI